MSQHYEVAIIGAGPAGIGAATNAAYHGISHVLIEKGELANTIHQYQLRKHVMAEPAKLPLRSRCRFKAGSREQILLEFAEDIAAAKVNLLQGEVTEISRDGERFTVKLGSVSLTANKIVMATGVQGAPRKLGVAGEELPHIAYTLSDAGAFSGKNIIVVGAGDAAIENALALSEQNSVWIVNRGLEFARAKDANARAVSQAIQSGKLRCLFNATINTIKADRVTVDTANGEEDIPCDHLIARLGCVAPRKFLESVGIRFPNNDPAAIPVVSESYESNVSGLYIVGALIGYPLIKQAINQGYEVIEHIRGEPVLPADQPLLEERFAHIPGGFTVNYDKIRADLPLFKDLSEPQLREVVIDSTLHLKEPGEIVFEKDDYTDTFWSVLSGAVEVELSEGRLVRLSVGQFFGEMGLLSGRRRVATVRAAEAGTVLIETPRKQVIKLISAVESVRRTLDELFVSRVLRRSVFPDGPAEFLDALVSKATTKVFKKGETLFSEGEVGEHLYVIRKGSVKVSRRNHSGEDVAQTYVPAGHTVGEMAVIEEGATKRSATVTAAVGCETIVLDKRDVLELFKSYPIARKHLDRIADERRVQNAVADWTDRSGSLLEFMMREGLTDAENVLLIDSDRCIGCDNCEAACASTHGGYSRLDRKGGKSFASIQIPISCRHCENPLCMLDCPPDALTRHANGEVIIRDSCIGCGNCVSNCPYGVIKLAYDADEVGWSLWSLFGKGLGKKSKEKGPAKAAKCDMCHELKGGPACVRACPTGAAMRINPARLVQIAGNAGGANLGRRDR
jgi:thioredoxin reductase/Fe-S-cluster-containing dehydrogenase component/CRP-like cAMP-binding protein